MAQDLVIFGAGGTCLDVLDLIDAINVVDGPRYNCIGFLDDDPDVIGTRPHGVPVLGPLAQARELPQSVAFLNGIALLNRHWLKAGILERVGMPLDRYVTLVHPRATVSARSTVGVGTTIFQHVSVMANAAIGDHVIMLAGCRINHHDVIGDYCDLASNVAIAGKVNVGQSCYLGIGATILGEAHIGEGSLVGAGSVVLHEVPPRTVVAGNPARVLRTRTLELS